MASLNGTRSAAERRVAADAARLAGLLVVAAASLPSPAWPTLLLIVAITVAATAAERIVGAAFIPLLAAFEGIASVGIAASVDGLALALVFLMVPPFVAGLSRGLRLSLLVSTAQLAAVAVASLVGANLSFEVLICVAIGLAVGVIGGLVGELLNRAILRLALAAAQSERRRLAAEIHDGIGQDLAVVAHRIDTLLLDDPVQVSASEVEGLGSDVRRALHETRWAIHDLRGGRVPEIGMGAALADHVRRTAAVGGIRAHLSISGGRGQPPEAVQSELLRIAQESVTNVRKHARADNLWVTLEATAKSALLVVADDGGGRTGQADEDFPRGFGIQIMRERAASIGADLEVRPRAGGGTVVEVHWAKQGLLPQLGSWGRILSPPAPGQFAHAQ